MEDVGVLEGIDPDILAYRSGELALRDDLRRVAVLRDLDAPEAVVIYCGRILETLLRDALVAVGFEPTSSVCTNLYLLEQYGLLPHLPRYAGHALRVAGNDARHVRRRLAPADAHVAVLLLECWLAWFFYESPCGPRLASGSGSAARVGLSRSDPLSDWAGRVIAYTSVRDGGEDLPELGEAALGSPAALAGVLAEALLERRRHEAAGRVLAAALHAHPDHVRLRQLLGLLRSREGRLAEAKEILEPLVRRHPEEEDAAGILGGVLKREWEADPTRQRSLQRAHSTYARGWVVSNRVNSYLGINAATTALFLGRQAAAREFARWVRSGLEDQDRRLRERTGGWARPDYWTRATLAEAVLLTGDTDAACGLYAALFASHAHLPGNVERTREQAARVLAALGLPATALEGTGAESTPA